MGTTLLHLLPEIIEDIENGLEAKGIHTDYPIGTCVVSLGFLLIVFIEMLAHTIQVGTLSKSSCVAYFHVFGVCV